MLLPQLPLSSRRNDLGLLDTLGVTFGDQPQGASPRFVRKPDASAWRLMRQLFPERFVVHN